MESPVPLGRQNVVPAAAVCEEAFRDAPLTHHFFPDAADRGRGALDMFRFMVNYAILYGEVNAPGPDIEGVACWLPHTTTTITLWRVFRAGWFRSLHMSRESRRRIMATDEYLTPRRLRIVPGEHIYLQVIAVKPEHQERGMGGRMLRHVLERADSDSIPCYLETFGQDHVDLYTHLGFKVAESSTIPGVQEPVFLMSHVSQSPRLGIN
jgi:ribosomal protein S18 acetylase RimI-like enzyme